jgi:hypothetical protein
MFCRKEKSDDKRFSLQGDVDKAEASVPAVVAQLLFGA